MAETAKIAGEIGLPPAQAGTSSTTGRVLYWIGIAMAIIAAGFGLFFYGFGISEWLADDMTFNGFDGVINFVFGFIGAAALTIALLIAGFILRFTPGTWPPRASLGLACFATLHVAFFSYFILTSLPDPDQASQRIALAICALLSFAAIALPPFLHWRNWQLASAAAQ